MIVVRVVRRLIALFLIFSAMGLSLALLAPVARLWNSRRFHSGAIVQGHLRIMCRAIGLRIWWQGVKPLPQTFLMLANHASYFDVIALGSLCPLGFMAKSEVSSWPVIGFLARRGTAVFVDRECRRSRVEALYRAKRILESGESSLCIFPEGTTTASIRPSLNHWYDGNITLGRGGAFETLCLGLHYADHEGLAWIDDQQLLPHLLRSLKRPHIDLAINAQIFTRPEGISHRAMSHLAHKMICKLADSAAERSHSMRAVRISPASRASFPTSQPWMFSMEGLEKSQKD